MGYRGYSVAKGHIVDSTNHGDFTTIQAGINAAVSGQTVFVRPGTYTENLTLKAGVDLVAYTADAVRPNVTIIGKATYTAAGNCVISGILLQTNSDFALVVSGSNAAQLTLINCNVNCTNNTGISYTNSNASSAIGLNYCTGDLATTGIALYSSSGAGAIVFRYGSFTNSGASTTASSNSAGSVSFSFSTIAFPISTSSGGVFNSIYTNHNTSTQNVTCLTTAGTGTSVIEYSDFISGSASAISIGSGTIINAVAYFRADSTNTNPITGAGSLNYGIVQLSNTGLVPNVTAMTPQATFGGGWSRIYTLTASASATLDFTNLPTYAIYAFVINNLKPATNATQLLLRASSNNGSTFAATGYTAGINYTSYNSATVTNVNATTSGPLTSNASNGVGISGIIYFTTGNGFFWGTTSYLSTDSAVNAFGTTGGGVGIVPNAFRFLMSSGNLTSGTITIYGLNNK